MTIIKGVALFLEKCNSPPHPRKKFQDLQERLPLCPGELYKHIDELEEAGTLFGVTQFGFCVLQDLLSSEHGILVSAQQCPHLRLFMLSLKAQIGINIRY